ncbi:MAG: hypothetical protein IJ215_03985 [Clostridia bacterium]|nr:hypothetical protein [Clostridia bacterium]
MEGKKKVSVSVILLVIAIIVIIVQAILNYQFCAEKRIAEEKVESLTNQIANLEGNVGNYRNTLDEIANIVNSALDITVDGNVESPSTDVLGGETTELGEENTDVTGTEESENAESVNETETETNEVV